MAGTRFAILIGVREYPHFGNLDTPYQDVACLRGCLKRLGFEIIERAQNVTGPIDKRVIIGAIEDVAVRLAATPASSEHPPCVLFYFAGHGIAVGGRNYLLSSQFNPDDNASLSCDGIDLEREVAVALTVRTDVQSVVLIDACRNEVRSTRPFVEPSFVPGRTLFGFATSPGQLAAEGRAEGQSPYSRALVQHLPVPGRSIFDSLSAVTDAVWEDTRERQRPTFTDHGVRLSLGEFFADAVDSGSHIAAPRTYGDAEIAAKRHLVRTLTATDATGRLARYYVLVEPECVNAFEAAVSANRGQIDLVNYGEVLASCYGEHPTQEVHDYLRDRYRIDVSAVPRAQAEKTTPSGHHATPAPPMMVALRQRMGFGHWKSLVMIVRPENRMPFAREADALASLEEGGLGADGRGIFGGLRRAVDSVNASHLDIEHLARFGAVIYRGDRSDIPVSVQRELGAKYGAVFDWADWEMANGVIVDLPS